MERASSPFIYNPIVPVQQQQQQPQQPKSRGRPRASYAQTGEFDLGLIREYRSRPALYDRSNKRFKDKMHSAQLWLQISHKLGYDVAMLRERMITLRNRYNIEKRRVEQNPQTLAQGSQWPLFENLSFLSEHIRSRRSYKTQSRSLDGRPDDDEDEEPFDVEDVNSMSNGHAPEIKIELDMDDEDVDDYEPQQKMPVTTVLSIPRHGTELNPQLHQLHMNDSSNINGHGANSSGIRQPELIVAVAKQKRSAIAQREEPPASRRRLNTTNTQATTAIAAEAATTATITYPKFRAFGEFVSHSLNELPHAMSLRLVESFTRELVQAAMVSEEQRQQQKHGSAEQSSVDEMED